MPVGSPPVLWSKLRPPSSTDGIIDRPRLVEAIVSSAAPVWVVRVPRG